MPRPILTITRVARRLGLSVRTIRAYEEEGFLTLERSRGRCFLRPEDVELIARVERLKADLGVNLAGAGVILEMRRKIRTLQAELAAWEEEFDQRVERALEERRREVERGLSPRGTRAVIEVRGEDD